MKKLISTLISFTIAFSALTAFAENNTDEMQEILVSVKDRIGDTQKYSEFNSSSRKINDETVYRFEWSNSSENGWSYMNVDCNSDGVITSYDIYDSEQKHSDSGLSINRTKKADALKAAQEAVNRLNP